MRTIVAALIATTAASFAATLGIDVISDRDTAMAVKYNGVSPSSDHPAFHVAGKKRGLHSVAINTSSARGLIGTVGAADPNPGSATVGVLGGGMVGVWGEAPNTGGAKGVIGKVTGYSETSSSAKQASSVPDTMESGQKEIILGYVPKESNTVFMLQSMAPVMDVSVYMEHQAPAHTHWELWGTHQDLVGLSLQV